MQEVGFQLYNDMLSAAVSRAEVRPRAGPRRAAWASPPKSTCTSPALLPEDYCNDVHERLVLYKRLANCETAEELDCHAGRTGRPLRPARPNQAQSLLACHRLRLVAKPLGVTKIDAGAERTTLQFIKQPPFDAGKLILLVQKDGRIRFAGPDRLRIDRAAPALAERVALVRDFLTRLA